jgi:hypothetical protein
MEDLSLGSLCGVHISRGEAWLTFSRITSYKQKMCGNCDQGTQSYIYRIRNFDDSFSVSFILENYCKSERQMDWRPESHLDPSRSRR